MDRKSQMLHLAEKMSALEDKKKREAYYLLLFLENFAGFPAGTILPWERPDFLVQTQRECIGIELSQWYFRDTTNEEHGSRLRAKESAEEKVLQRAASGYERRGLPHVDVFVHWSHLLGLRFVLGRNVAAAHGVPVLSPLLILTPYTGLILRQFGCNNL
jgi:hypothetical protein